jgi:hypothetical protein
LEIWKHMNISWVHMQLSRNNSIAVNNVNSASILPVITTSGCVRINYLMHTSVLTLDSTQNWIELQ